MASIETPHEVAGRVARVGLAVGVVAAGVQGIAHVVDFVVFDLEVDLIRAETDTGAFAWLSIVVTGCAAFVCLLLALVEARERLRLIALTIIVGFLSLDDMVQFHERVSGLWRNLGLPERWHLARLLWPVVFFPLLALAFLLLWETGRRLGGSARLPVVMGLALLAAAIALEASSPILFRIGYGHGTWPYELEVVLEEGAELAGWIWITAGLAAGLVALDTRRPTPDGNVGHEVEVGDESV